MVTSDHAQLALLRQLSSTGQKLVPVAVRRPGTAGWPENAFTSPDQHLAALKCAADVLGVGNMETRWPPGRLRSPMARLGAVIAFRRSEHQG